ncbi:unnamed protein product [Heligmosomoides polygyrus]|uniref:Uncharacterized protein n=1 Tax=Heligmosomoides polygyrus TaxID=6339 RepID=A0A183FED8_HELPZ|nr:unnamed protein product [Heligmosomoides polygyrus]
MRPSTVRCRPLRISDEDPPPPSPPNYEVIFPPKHAPPPYSQLVLRPVQSTWTVDRGPLAPTTKTRPTWAGQPRPLADSYLAPFESHSKDGSSTVFPCATMARNGFVTPENLPTARPADTTMSTISLTSESSGLTPRNTPRQASFMAAMSRQQMRDQDDAVLLIHHEDKVDPFKCAMTVEERSADASCNTILTNTPPNGCRIPISDGAPKL